MSKFSMRIAGAVAASALTIACTGFAGAQEIGGETIPEPATLEQANLVNNDANVSLTIQKYLGDPGQTDTPLGGVQFRIERINGVNLSTQEGWKKAAELKAETANDFTEVATVTTEDNGTVTLRTEDNDEFTVGLYKITELQKAGYTAAAPFLVALPHSENGQWSYSQTVKPKNQKITPTKQVKDTGVTVGDNLTYTVNAPVPAGALSRFNVVDPLVAGLTYVANSAKISLAGDTTNTALAAEDYTISNEGNTLRVNFTDAGRAKLETARKSSPALKVLVEFQATVSEQAINAQGQITNTATIELPNGATVDTNGDDPATEQVENNPTATTFGTLTITKTTTNGDKSLNGAEFELYQCTVNEGKGTLVGQALNVKPAGQDNRTIATTAGGDAQGGNATATISNIPLNSFAAGTGVEAIQYCVLETKAPEGYVRNPEPQVVTAVEGQARQLAVSVDNQKNSVLGQLPATGAWGIVLVFLLGLLLLARGLYTSYQDSRA
ncbi:SpaH/EbpB family LPXTG-anchored major pilin [Corynebacterium lizhenjunii]|uniref:SpaH/EbpB family LPXTG-anchored major pilin n=1 Tax=Corynebacterium lizhenjunii TaxID=2709394 RepID=UPI0013EAA711|nr:SpaH/EbpB family LPXTG-anchored major pilin [Corynebacterium lizhenjunii]